MHPKALVHEGIESYRRYWLTSIERVPAETRLFGEGPMVPGVKAVDSTGQIAGSRPELR